VALLTGWALTVGPVAVALLILNRRDRRQAALATEAYRLFDAEALRTDVVVETRCGLLGGAGHVTVDMRGASREAVWDAVVRLRRGLPAAVRLVVLGPVAPARPARITVEWPQPRASNSPAGLAPSPDPASTRGPGTGYDPVSCRSSS
jgi:hypothetical protein